ncbi:MAG: nitronate monooxygenase [Gemmatimonadaceae bacterium]
MDSSALGMTLAQWLGIELPIIQAPMAGVQGSDLAVAVAQAGGLGSLPCALLSTEQMRSELASVRARTDRPINVNFFCHTPPAPDPVRDAMWRARLAPYYREFGLDVDAFVDRPGRTPFNEEALQLLEEFRPAVVSFHFGLPAESLLARVRATGAKVLGSATTVDEARFLEAHGVDAIIAQGAEAGGHRGMFLTGDVHTQVGTFALLPQIVRAVRVPVIAAGGIADAPTMAAAQALGAVGSQVGTSYLLCREVATTDIHRAAIQTAGGAQTVITNVLTGRPARGLMNRLMRELGPLSDLAPAFPSASAAIAPLRAAAESLGRDDFSTMWCGQNTSGCRDASAAEVSHELCAWVR